MISKATAKFIKSLQLKKFRLQHKAFIVEGAKSVLELLYARYPIKEIVATADFISQNQALLKSHNVHEIKAAELESLGTLKSNNAALAVTEIILPEEPQWSNVPYSIILDGINDPGNLGTIIRIADWYGINHIVASPQTAELYNPKVISSTKGSFLRVKVFYKDLSSFFEQNPKPVIGTFMDGEPVHSFQWPEEGYIIMGSEANGVSSELSQKIDFKIAIPGKGRAESLNVAIATAVVLDNWFRSVR